MNRDFISPRPLTQEERDAWLWQQKEWLELIRKEINAPSPYFRSYERPKATEIASKRIERMNYLVEIAERLKRKLA